MWYLATRYIYLLVQVEYFPSLNFLFAHFIHHLIDDSFHQVYRARASLLPSWFLLPQRFPPASTSLRSKFIWALEHSFSQGLQLWICREGSLILFSEAIGVYGPTTWTLTPSSTNASATGCTIYSEQTWILLIHNDGQGQHYFQALQVAGFDERSERPGLQCVIRSVALVSVLTC